MEKVVNRLLILVVLLLMSACSFKTLYNNFDYLIPEYLEGMVTMDALMQDEVSARSEQFMEWHRKTQLKGYVEWMKKIKQQAGPDMTKAQVVERIEETDVFWKVLSIKLNNELAEVLPLLSKESANELFSDLERKNEVFREEYIEVDLEERNNIYAEKLIDNYEFWLDDLTEYQERSVRKAAQMQYDTAELRLQRRLDWHRDVRAILESEAEREDKTKMLKNYLNQFETINTPAFKKTADSNREIIVKLTLVISHTMTDDQIRYFQDKTAHYIRMFTELAEGR